MRQVVICQFTILQQRIDMRQTGLWTIAFGNRHGAIEIDDRRRLDPHQVVVKRDNLPPVGCTFGIKLAIVSFAATCRQASGSVRNLLFERRS